MHLAAPSTPPAWRDAAAISADGRHARRGRNREAVVTAVVEFLTEGNPYPTAPAVADRSGVSLRSVFRYFDDLDTLLLAAVDALAARHTDRLRLRLPAGGTTLDERIDALIDHRIALHPVTARTLVATQMRAATSPLLRDAVERVRVAATEDLRALFAPELDALDDADRATVVAALHTATMAETWVNLADRHGLDTDGQRAVLQRLIRGALGLLPR